MLLATQIALFVTQEIGARMALATGQGLTGLIRERFGVRWAAFAAMTMIVAANLGCIVSEFAGVSAALSLFGVPVAGQCARRGRRRHRPDQLWGSFSRPELLFVGIGVIVSAAYMISAILAKPDWVWRCRASSNPQGPFNGRLLPGRRGHGRHDHHAVGSGLHPGLCRGQAPASRGTARPNSSTCSSAC